MTRTWPPFTPPLISHYCCILANTFQMTRLQRLRTLATVAYDPEDDIDPDEALMATGCSPAPAVQNTPKAGGLDVPEDVPEVICEDVKENEASTSPVPPEGSIRSDP